MRACCIIYASWQGAYEKTLTFFYRRGSCENLQKLLVKLERRFPPQSTYYRTTHALVLAIQTIVISIADPLRVDAGAARATVHLRRTLEA